MTLHASFVQGDLFAPESSQPAGPEGLRYQPELITAQEEAALIAALATLPFEPFDFHGYKANREVVAYGWRYDFANRAIARAEPIPQFLHGLRARAAAFARRPAEAFVQVLINAYRPGAGVGWHRDKPCFGEVVGVSLGSASPFRFRRREGEGWARRTLVVEPRSAYLMIGPARWDWEHSVPPVERPRWSITLRTLA
jgi:alkylated DNA repair dioxygenase AlkB